MTHCNKGTSEVFQKFYIHLAVQYVKKSSVSILKTSNNPVISSSPESKPVKSFYLILNLYSARLVSNRQYCQPRTTPIMELNSKSGVEPPILELGKASNLRIEAGDPDDKILHFKRFMNVKSDLKYSYKKCWKG